MLRNSALEVFQILACCTIFYYCAHAQIVLPRSASRPTTIRIPVYILSVYLSYTIVTLPVIILAMITEIIHDIALNNLKHMDHKDRNIKKENSRLKNFVSPKIIIYFMHVKFSNKGRTRPIIYSMMSYID